LAGSEKGKEEGDRPVLGGRFLRVAEIGRGGGGGKGGGVFKKKKRYRYTKGGLFPIIQEKKDLARKSKKGHAKTTKRELEKRGVAQCR